MDFIESKIYSGIYGGETNNVGDLIVTEINCPSRTITMNGKQIIFVVDESGSMIHTLPTVQATLFAARDTLFKLTGELGNVQLITFSEKAQLKWSPSSTQMTFDEAIECLTASSSTNMGDALKLAFDLCNSEYATWIILFTDGVANRGPYQTLDGFKSLMKNLPIRTKIVPLGYTTDFDPDILSILGNMTYIESKEIIAETIGSIIAEIVTCYGVDGKINLPNIKHEIQLDDITPIDLNIKPKTVIGDTNVGCLFNERRYVYGYLPFGNNLNNDINQYINKEGTLTYYDLKLKEHITIKFIIEKGNTIPDSIIEDYFIASKGRILLSVYRGSANIEVIKQKLEDWKHSKAQNHKEEILRILNNFKQNRHDKCKVMTTYCGSVYQTNYTYDGRYTTNTQRTTSLYSSEQANLYNPSINI